MADPRALAAAIDQGYDPFASEKYANPAVKDTLTGLTDWHRPPDDPNDPILYRTASPLVNIRQGDIDKGIGVAMGVGAPLVFTVS